MKKKSAPFFARRKLTKEFKRLDESGKTGQGTDSTQLISEDREDRVYGEAGQGDGSRAAGSKLAATDRQLAAAYARGRRFRKKLQAADGGSVSTAEAAARVGKSVATVRRWYRTGKLVGWKDEGNQNVRIPTWQYSGNKVLPGLAEVLAFAKQGWECLNDHGRMLFLLSKSPVLKGRRPLDLLREGNTEAVKEAVLYHLWP